MIEIDGRSLTIEQVCQVARQDVEVRLAERARQDVQKAHDWVKQISLGSTPVYGINTGFGIFSEKPISKEKIALLNRNLILSHAVGTGPDFPPEVVRAAILIRCNTLAGGHSGIRPQLLDNLLTMLRQNLIPCIPSQGSLGSSGDLAPLSHLALVLSTDSADLDGESGWALLAGQRMSGKAAMEKAGIPRLELKAKEGLALTNGATFSAALAAMTCDLGQVLAETAEVALAASLEALMGVSNAFDERIHIIRRQEGQQQVAARVRQLTAGSTLLDGAGRVQDAYSLRCAPQVQGPARDTLNFTRQIINREINAVTDNPLIFGPGEAISGGNFHGEVVGMVMDFLKIAMTELGAISERRVFQLTDTKMNFNLPPMLVDNLEAAGLNSGLMMPQYTAASLVLENQHLSTPDSVNSLPTSGGKEDHNANSMTAARHAFEIANNTAHILAIELYTAMRAIDIRLREAPKARLGKGVEQAYHRLRTAVPYRAGDAWWGPEIEQVKQMVLDRQFTLSEF